jgi:hypothetical protein
MPSIVEHLVELTFPTSLVHAQIGAAVLGRRGDAWVVVGRLIMVRVGRDLVASA